MPIKKSETELNEKGIFKYIPTVQVQVEIAVAPL